MTGPKRYLIIHLAAVALTATPAARADNQPIDRHSARADSLAQHAEALYTAGKYEDSQVAYQTRIYVLREHFGDDHPDIVKSMVRLSETHWKMGRHALGEQIARDAIALAKRVLGDDDPQVGQGLNMLGLCCMAQSKFDEAGAAYHAALVLFKEHIGEENEEVAMVLENLGALAGETLEWIRADAFHRASLAMYRKLLGDDNLLVARGMHDIGFAAGARGDLLTAQEFLEEALEMRRRHLGDEHPDVGLTLQILASNYVLNDMDRAYELYQQALDIRRRTLGERHPLVAWNLRVMATWNMSRGHYEVAETQLREMLAIYEQSNEIMEYGRGLMEMAKLKLCMGELSAAEELLVQARQKGLDRHGHERPNTLVSMAHIRSHQGRHAEAEVLLIAAVDAYEETRLPYAARSRALVNIYSPYVLLAATYLWQGKPELAWPAAERARGRALIDQLAGVQGNDVGRVCSLEEVQGVLEPGDAIVGWLDVVRWSKPAAWAYVIRHTGPVHWAEIKDEAGLDTQTWRGQRAAISERPARFRETLLYAAAWATRVTEVDRILQDGNALWQERLAPVDAFLSNASHLIVIPSDVMSGIPIEALVGDDGVTVGDRFDVSYAPSATVYRLLVDRGKAGRRTIERALLVGDPHFSQDHLDRPAEVAMAPVLDATVLRSALAGNKEALATLPALPQSRDEVTGIAAMVTESTVLLGRYASEEAIATIVASGRLIQYDAVHFATHAIVDAVSPDISALVLSQVALSDPPNVAAKYELTDGLLSVGEIFRDWKLDAKIVTLSGCQTGLGRKSAGEGYLGFAQAFFHAGAQSVVLSLWDVDDTATAMLMTRFYENLTGNYDVVRGSSPPGPMTKSAALREAKLWLRNYEKDGIRPFVHPTYWASFILIGDAG